MHNDLNSNSNMPENPKTHYYNKSGELIITDVLQYFQDTIESPNTYSFRIQFTEAKDAAISIIYADKTNARSAALTVEQSEALWSHVVESQHELENMHGMSVEFKAPPTYTRRSVFLTNESRRSSETMITQLSVPKNYTHKQAMYDFVEDAYVTGISIIIGGKTGSGRTQLLNELMNAAKDYNATFLISPLPEMSFGSDHPEITEIRGDDPAYLVAQVLRMRPVRVVMDDMFIDEKTMESIVVSAKTGTQFVATDYTDTSEKSIEIDQLSSRYAEHPYELRVHVDIRQNDTTNKREFEILSVQQIVHQKIRGYDITSNRLLFDQEKMVAEPTRALRRKMEAGKRLASAQKKVSNIPVSGENPISALVSLTTEERAELHEHREALREHFKTQNVLLRTSFREIERILAKF